jgi:predicted HD phosphohydrolase
MTHADRSPGDREAAGSSAGAEKLRRRIAEEAARLVREGGDSHRARLRAARRVARGWVPDDQLPSHAEIRREVQAGLDGPRTLAHDRFDRIADLVRVLATVRQDPKRHPEGDALEHSLQVFDLVRDERPFDEELLTAALVHEVGRTIDRGDPVAAGIEALGDLVTPRTRWLVESLESAHAHADGTLGLRARHRLEAHPDFLDAILLAEADRRGRVRGYDAASLDEAIAFLRSLDGGDAVNDGQADGEDEGA